MRSSAGGAAHATMASWPDRLPVAATCTTRASERRCSTEVRLIMQDFVILGNVSDDPFAIDIGHLCGQPREISDLISLKVFANTEFCPRFISDEHDLEHIGASLEGKTAIICSSG